MVDTLPSPPLLSRAAAMVRKRPDYDPVLSAGPQYVEYFHRDGHIEQKAVYDDRNLIAKFGLINCDLCRYYLPLTSTLGTGLFVKHRDSDECKKEVKREMKAAAKTQKQGM